MARSAGRAAGARIVVQTQEQVSVSPATFGAAAFRLADRAAPPPFDGQGTPNPAFFDYASQMVRQAAQQGRTLVLCAGYADVDALSGRLPDQYIVQRRGQSLRPLSERFAGEPGAVLITPAGWAGLDLPHLVDNVVIVRLPIPPLDDLREIVLAEALQARGMSRADARKILLSEGRGDAMRRLTQGMGRGIRTAEDRCTIWIADPRFPLPSNMVIDVRRGLSQGQATEWRDMAKAIPRRFRDGPRSAYGRAKIVPLAPEADASTASA
jgi:ATP-dependent DNA helicase DinG